MAGYQLLLNTGERVVPAGTASLLVATAPVYASVLAVMFLGEHPGRRWWIGSAVALGGTAVIAVSHGLGFGASALIVLAAAVLQGIFHTAQKPLLARYTSFEVTAYAMWAGTVFILPWSGVAGAGAAARGRWGGRRGGVPGRGAVGGRVRRGPTPWPGWTSGGSRPACTWCPAAAILISLVWLGQVPGPVELGGGAVALAGVALAGSRPRAAGRSGWPVTSHRVQLSPASPGGGRSSRPERGRSADRQGTRPDARR